MKLWARWILLGLSLAVYAPAAMAEEEDGLEYEALDAAPRQAAKPRPRAKAAPKLEPEVKLPDGPVPYKTLEGAILTAPAGVTEALEHKVIPSLPTPAPVQVEPVPAPVAPAPEPEPAPSAAATEVLTLRCETQKVASGKPVSQGAFFLEITPSEVFDDSARFRVMFADPRHESLIKETLCETLNCPVRISTQFYELFNSRTKSGKALKVTLDRRDGAYLAQNRDKDTDVGSYEQGYCQPQREDRRLF